MKSVSIYTLRRSLKKMLDAVHDSHDPLVVQRPDGRSVVLLSLEDYEAMREAPETVTMSDDPFLTSFSDVDEIRFVPAPADFPSRRSH